MGLGGVTALIQDGQLGQTAQVGNQSLIVIGVSSAGVAGTGKLYPGGQQSILQLITDYGYGPGVQAVARVLAKGFACAFVKVTSTTAGSQSAVTATRVASSTSAVTTTGTALDFYQPLAIRVLAGGTIGVAGIALQYSYDGILWSAAQRLGTANSFLVPNSGVTFALGAGTLDTGDQFSVLCIEPKWGASALATALTAAYGSGLPKDILQVVGSCSATEQATVKSQLTSLETALFFTRAITETVRCTMPWSAANDATWQAALITDYASFTSKREAIGAGDLLTISPVDQSTYFRPLAWHAAEDVASFDSAIYELGRVKQDGVGTGALDGSLFDSNGNQVCHNEFVNPGLDSNTSLAAIGFMTARTYPTKNQAVYITEAKLFSPVGSDFRTFRLGRDMDLACSIVTDVLTNEIQETPQLNSDGTIAELYALFVEQECSSRLQDEMVDLGRISGFTVVVDRNNNVAITDLINVAVSILPRGEIRSISEVLGFAATLPTLT